ncbi:four helix bundle protein [Pseudoalteromonas sp.]|uniref:four helix bundle protein n=1 Tax=Pseudoalteromonas sp. TaxID=53249 RepID=UPI003002B811
MFLSILLRVMMRFEQLHVWQRSADLACEVYIHFKTSKEFGLKDQITRSALSISSNIAEGHERKTTKDYARFLSYAKGSCGELRSQLQIACKIGEIEEASAVNWINESIEISKMLTGLMNTVNSWEP